MTRYQLAVWIGSTQENVTLPERDHAPEPGEIVEAEGHRWRVIGIHTNATGELVPDLFDAERLHSIEVATSRRNVVLPWPSREALLDELSHRAIRDAFEAVGTSSPVKLTNDQKAELVTRIDDWANRLAQVGNGKDDLPEGVWKLRNELRDDLNDAAKTDT